MKHISKIIPHVLHEVKHRELMERVDIALNDDAMPDPRSREGGAFFTYDWELAEYVPQQWVIDTRNFARLCEQFGLKRKNIQ